MNKFDVVKLLIKYWYIIYVLLKQDKDLYLEGFQSYFFKVYFLYCNESYFC